jgi:hypothetical protein
VTVWGYRERVIVIGSGRTTLQAYSCARRHSLDTVVTLPRSSPDSVYEIIPYICLLFFLGGDLLAGEQPCQGRSEAEPVRVALTRLVAGHTLRF